MFRFPRQSGVTLIELLIAIAVLAVLLAAGMPSFAEWTTNMRIRTVGESMLNGLKTARMEAVKQNTLVYFNIDSLPSPHWHVRRVSDNADLAQSEFGETPVEVQVGGDTARRVVFNGLGLVSESSGSTIDLSVPESVLPASKTRNLRILVSGGLLKLCDPNVSGDPRAC